MIDLKILESIEKIWAKLTAPLCIMIGLILIIIYCMEVGEKPSVWFLWIGIILVTIGTAKIVDNIIVPKYNQLVKRKEIKKSIDNLDLDCKKIIDYMYKNQTATYTAQSFSGKQHIEKEYAICLGLMKKSILIQTGQKGYESLFNLSSVAEKHIFKN